MWLFQSPRHTQLAHFDRTGPQCVVSHSRSGGHRPNPFLVDRLELGGRAGLGPRLPPSLLGTGTPDALLRNKELQYQSMNQV